MITSVIKERNVGGREGKGEEEREIEREREREREKGREGKLCKTSSIR